MTNLLNQVFHADCLDKMKDIPDKSIDMILCDLPYQMINYEWDIEIPFDKLWEQYERIIKDNSAIVLFGNQPFTSKLILSNLPFYKYELIWHKTRNSHPFFAKIRPLPQHENLIIFGRGKLKYNPQMIISDKPYKVNKNTNGNTNGANSGKKWSGESEERTARYPNSVITISNPSRKVGLHSTQKPVELCEYLIKTFSNENDIILDNCAGSGSTLIAARNTNRQFIGIEKDQIYYDKIVKRLGSD